MHAVVRTYAGAGAVAMFDALGPRKADIEAAMRTVPGLVSYAMVRTADGGITITVCQDKAGADASAATARDWMAKNITGVSAPAPTVSEGPVLAHVK
jgi:hypothetical protein